MSHKIIRSELGKALQIVVDESKRRLWDDVAELLLEGIGWKNLEEELHKRYGHVDEDGKQYKRLRMYSTINHPMFWGNSATHFRSGKNGTKTDMWVFDPNEPAPEGVTIHYDVIEPVYTGEIAEQIQAELRRRRLSVRGNNRPNRSKAFSGLFICAGCGYYLTYHANKGFPGYKCVSTNWQDEKRPDCAMRKYIPEWKVQQWLDARLEEMINGDGKPTLFIGETSNEVEYINKRIGVLKAEIEVTDEKIRRLVNQRASTTTEILATIIDDEITKAVGQLEAMLQNLAGLERQKPSTSVIAGQVKAFEEIKEMSLDSFWDLPEVEINQLLHRVFGNHRLAIENGDIIGVVDAPKH